MKSVWARFVFVICTLTTLLYTAVGVGAMLNNQGKAHIFTSDAPESVAIFFGLMFAHFLVSAALHVLSFIFSGNSTQLECMLHWWIVPAVILIACFIFGGKVSAGWAQAFSLPCEGVFALFLSGGVIASELVVTIRPMIDMTNKNHRYKRSATGTGLSLRINSFTLT